MSLNKVSLIGNLCQEPEKRITSGGNSVVSISLATNEKYTDKAGNKQQNSEFHRLVFWNKTADLVETYCKKGSKLYIEGSLKTREWLDKDNQKRATTEIIVREMQFLDNRSQQPAQPQQQPQNQNFNQNGHYGQPGQPNGTAYTQPAAQPNIQTPPKNPVILPDDGILEDDIPF
jgi:single-strand DNA-binding protein